MSATTTDNRVTTTLQADYLQDYNIRLTGGDNGEDDGSTPQLRQRPAGPNTDNRPSLQQGVENPSWWDDEHRQVPPYRPVNRNLDHEQRPWGSNPVESVFVFHMVQGVWLNSTIAWVWRKTGGRVTDQIFRFRVGGEY